MRQTITTYGPGGYDPTKPNNNVVEEVEVDVPEPEPDPREARIAALEAEVAALKQRAEAVERDVTAVRSTAR